MDCKKAKILNIVIALSFAAAMLVTSYLVADKDLSQNVNFLLIAIWLVPFFYLSKKMNNK